MGDEDNIHQLPQRDTGDGLTVRQRKVLEVIRNAVATRGYPPSLREIGELVGLTSPSSVAHQLSSLERKGYLRRDPNRPRAIEVISPDDSTPAVAAEVTDLTDGMRGGASTHDEVVDPTGSGDERPEASYVPVLGQIAAGFPRRVGTEQFHQLHDPALFEHEPKAERHGSAGYCTGSGARIVTSSGGRASTARVASSAVHKASFGGFGATGRSFSSGSSSHGSASG